MNAARDGAHGGTGFTSILSGDPASDRAERWSLPSFDDLIRPREEAPPPELPTAQQVEQIEAEAFREGHARGYADGYAQGATAARAEAERLAQLLRHLGAPLAELDAQTENALVALSLELARRLVQQELQTDPAKMLGIVREAVSHLAQPARGLRVHLHPDDVRVVAEHLPEAGSADGWTLVPDRGLMPGDCVIESDTARVDARLDTRQAQLAQRLLGDAP